MYTEINKGIVTDLRLSGFNEYKPKCFRRNNFEIILFDDNKMSIVEQYYYGDDEISGNTVFYGHIRNTITLGIILDATINQGR